MNPDIRVLVVDDDDVIREIASLSLRRDPRFEVRALASATAALDMLDRGDWTPDILLLDVMMADMDGPTALAKLRATDRGAQLPVVFVTAKTHGTTTADLIAAGASGVILKPFAPLGLCKVVEDFVRAARIAKHWP